MTTRVECGPLELVTAPAGLPVTLVEAESHLHYPAEDAGYVARLLAMATEWAEREAPGGRTYFRSATYDLPLSDWWCGRLQLPRPPLLTVVSVSYLDLAGSLIAYSSANWVVRRPLREPGYVLWANASVTRPSLYPYRGYPVTVRFTAGTESPPERVKQVILMLAAHAYRFRGDDGAGVPEADAIPKAAAALLATEDYGFYG